MSSVWAEFLQDNRHISRRLRVWIHNEKQQMPGQSYTLKREEVQVVRHHWTISSEGETYSRMITDDELV